MEKFHVNMVGLPNTPGTCLQARASTPLLTEDLIVCLPGMASACIKTYWESPDNVFIETQEKAQKAQKALGRIDSAIVQKDKVRTRIGVLQNRFENTVTNLNVQAENLQAAESRNSDANVVTEMTEFVMIQSAIAMLSQAKSLPQMTMQIIGG